MIPRSRSQPFIPLQRTRARLRALLIRKLHQLLRSIRNKGARPLLPVPHATESRKPNHHYPKKIAA